tara:strand:+ start:1502 stop:3169 length:1668 start_codon:yes stop_codon:yes gene_type:complete
MALYDQANETTIRRVAKSPRMRLVQKVLESRSDNSGSKWNTRSFWVAEVIETWDRKFYSHRTDRGASYSLDKIEKMRFDPLMKHTDPVIQAEAWDAFRTKVINNIRDAFLAGCSWLHVLQRLLSAAKPKDTGNPRVLSYVKEFLDDHTMLNEYQVLGADTFVARMDDSFKTTNFGEDSDQNEWAKTITRIPGEDILTLNSRVMTAYEKFSGHPGDRIHLDHHHKKIMFQRLSVCLRADLQDKERGQINQKRWLEAITNAEQDFEYAIEGSQPWSSERILKRFVIGQETAEATVKAQNQEERESERDGARYVHEPRTRSRNDPRQRQAGAVMAVTNYEENWTRETETPEMVGAVPMAPHPAPNPTRGPGRGPAPTHQREPPPARLGLTPEETRLKRWGRDCGPPAGNKGHPNGKTWDDREWRFARIDYDKICRLAANPEAQVAMNRFVPLNKQMNSARKTTPKRDETGQWGPDSCLFCANRPLEQRQMNEAQRFQSGSGRGDHMPQTCQIARRYLCEGGDHESRPFASELQKCIIIRVPDNHRERPRDGGQAPPRV